eukprot:scaffold679_cov374-Prasinococcus_capsulatus_cf.AAC.7
MFSVCLIHDNPLPYIHPPPPSGPIIARRRRAQIQTQTRASTRAARPRSRRTVHPRTGGGYVKNLPHGTSRAGRRTGAPRAAATGNKRPSGSFRDGELGLNLSVHVQTWHALDAVDGGRVAAPPWWRI